MYRARRGSITGRLTSAPSIVRQPSFAARNCSVVSVQLSAIPRTGIGNRFPSSSKLNRPVKLRGFLLSKLTSTGSLLLGDADHLTLRPLDLQRHREFVCRKLAGDAHVIETLMSQSLRVVTTPSGVGANRTSLSSNLILGCAPSPRRRSEDARSLSSPRRPGTPAPCPRTWSPASARSCT